MTWKCLFDGGLGLDGSRNLFSLGIMFNSKRLMCSNWKSLFDEEDAMINIKKALINKGQTEDSKRGYLVGN